MHQEVEENVVSYIRHVYGPEKPSGTKEKTTLRKKSKLGYLPKPASGLVIALEANGRFLSGGGYGVFGSPRNDELAKKQRAS